MTPGSVFFDMRDVSSLPILVVDDKDSYANFLFFSLKEAGYSSTISQILPITLIVMILIF